MKFISKYSVFILILVFSFFAFKPLISQGFFPIHDDTQVARTFEMTKALKDGMFPVRWSQDLGYGFGYPIFNFYNPLPYYVSGLISLFGFDALSATKLMVILAIVLSGFSMYLLSKEFFGKKGALFSSLLYVLAPFHAVEVYVRGDFAENFAYAFIPLLFYGLLKIHKNYSWKYVIITAISYAGVILSHNLTAMMVSLFVVFFIAYLLVRERKDFFKNLIRFSPGLFIGVLISAFYWLPAIFEMKYTDVLSQIGGGANFRDHFVCLTQLWISQWGYGGSVKGCIDGFSFMIGKYHIFLSVLMFFVSIVFVFSKKYLKIPSKEKEIFYFIIFLFLSFLLSIFFMLNISQPVWEIIKPMEFFQYPWRFLIMASFFASFIGGSLFFVLEKLIQDKNKYHLLVFFAFIFMIFVSLKFFVPQEILSKNSKDYTSKHALNWEASKISDEYLPKSFIVPQSEYQIPDITNLITPEISIRILQRKTQYTKLEVNIRSVGDYILPLSYFPAWQAKIDGKEEKLKQGLRGSIISLPKGKHILELSFVQTPIEKLGNLISVAGILLLFAGIIQLKAKI
ncbi:MAG: glycosyltransferase family 39 protein [Actinobacteria bacterium]|nr:glycosyltransferase family 39 protein [Actinomycetota bacterium]